MEHLFERINNLIITLSNIRNQLKFMKTILSISPNIPDIMNETEQELKRIRRSLDTTTLGSSLFPFGIQYVYVWELEEGKYYVGWSENLSRRLDEHTTDEGAVWTKRYKPVGIVEIIRGDKHVEKSKTLEYIKKKGFANVRGSIWCHVEYKSVPLEVQKYLAKDTV
jgi:predicted GIY-YIG superfamily endonuclease